MTDSEDTKFELRLCQAGVGLGQVVIAGSRPPGAHQSIHTRPTENVVPGFAMFGGWQLCSLNKLLLLLLAVNCPSFKPNVRVRAYINERHRVLGHVAAPISPGWLPHVMSIPASTLYSTLLLYTKAFSSSRN